MGETFPKEIVILTSPFIGDTVLFLPILQDMLAQKPESTNISIVCPPVLRNLLDVIPGINAIVSDTGPPHQILKQLKPDTLIMLRYSWQWLVAAKILGIRSRIGWDVCRLGLPRFMDHVGLLTHPIPSGTIHDRQSQSKFLQQFLTPFGFSPQTDFFAYPLPTEDQHRILSKIERCPSPRILIHATAGSYGKTWDTQKLIALMHALYQRYQSSLIVVGTSEEVALYQRLSYCAKAPLVNLCGQTTLRETMAILKEIDLVITLDTSIAHLAALAETKNLIVLYGPTNEHQWRPVVSHRTRLIQLALDLSCRPCVTRTCLTKPCLNQLSVHHVLRATEACLGESSPALGSSHVSVSSIQPPLVNSG